MMELRLASQELDADPPTGAPLLMIAVVPPLLMLLRHALLVTMPITMMVVMPTILV